MNLRFIGTPSLGLIPGRTYRVEVRLRYPAGVQLIAPVRCPYDSDAAFWNNWTWP